MESCNNVLIANEFRITSEVINVYINEIKEQLITDGGVVMGECLLNVIDETFYEYSSKNNLLVLPEDYPTLAWIIFKEIEADNRIIITKD